MIEKIRLYTDSMMRMDQSQLFHWIFNRYIKDKIPFLFSSKKINYDEFKKTNAKQFKERLTDLFSAQDKIIPIWKLGVTEVENEHSYFVQMKMFSDEYLSTQNLKPLEIYWSQDYDDVEILNNYHRFHLFDELLDEHFLDSDLGLRIIELWIDQCRDKKHIAWNGFNTSVRLINWLKILYKTPVKYFEDINRWQKIQKSIYYQIFHIKNNIEVHIPGNHVLIQIFSLWLLFASFENWKNSSRYLNESAQNLTKEFEKEYLESGLHFEQSFHYHIQITLVGIIWIEILEKQKMKIPSHLFKLMENAEKIINKFLFPDNTCPMLGDNCFTFLHQSLEEDIQNLSFLSERKFAKPFLNKNKIDCFEIPNQYLIGKVEESKIIVDVGNLGLWQNAGHGHSDLLSFVYSYKKQPIFIDAGIKRYNNDPGDLNLKRTAYHNTLSVDNSDQAKLWGFFRWGYLPDQPIYSYEVHKEFLSIFAEFIGFKKIGGYKHSRQFYLYEEDFKIEDTVVGKQDKTISLNFVLAPTIFTDVVDSFVELSNSDFKWKLMVTSKSNFSINLNEIEIYPSYDVAVKSRKIEINFESVSFPFKSEVIFKRLY